MEKDQILWILELMSKRCSRTQAELDALSLAVKLIEAQPEENIVSAEYGQGAKQ